jgi:hypothetical protein
MINQVALWKACGGRVSARIPGDGDYLWCWSAGVEVQQNRCENNLKLTIGSGGSGVAHRDATMVRGGG